LAEPPRHWIPHEPWEQTSPAAHGFPQPPQFAGSFWISTQRPPHAVVPPEHASAQVPPEQTSPGAHVVPQPPQFAGSVWVLTQLWPHFVEPPPHESAQAPPEQTSPAAHVVPQAPQFVGSLWMATQPPSHLSWPGGQTCPPVEVPPFVVDGLSSEQLTAMIAARNAQTAIHRRGSVRNVAMAWGASQGCRARTASCCIRSESEETILITTVFGRISRVKKPGFRIRGRGPAQPCAGVTWTPWYLSISSV
jgi:hypothetical protein